MKITVKNLGAVKEAEINLKPLTVFVGHNGTGKTWTAYALAAIFSPYGHDRYVRSYIEGKTQQKFPVLEEVVDKFSEEGSAELDIVQFAKENLQAYINDVASLASGWMHNYLSTKRVNFDDLSLQIDLQGHETRLIGKVEKTQAEGRIPFLSKQLNVLKEKNADKVFFFMESKGKAKEKEIPSKIIRYFVCQWVFQILHRIFFFDTFLFPTERTAFITLPIHDEKSGNTDEPKQGKELSHPILNFKNMVSDASSLTLRDREEQITEKPQIKNYLTLADFLEENILRGNANFEESGIDKELLFSNENVQLEINVTSSMTNLISKMLQPSEAKPLGEAQRRWRQRSGAWEACRAGTDG